MPDFGIFRGFNEKLFGDKLYAGQLPTQLGLIGSQNITPFLLDLYPNAAAAYSLRKLRTLYTGSAIRVRRSSDNTEQDIGFVDNQLDTSTLTTFCGVGNGFVKTWYDQSGSARNATQTTAINQPQIVSSGSVILDVNSNPHIRFTTSSSTFLQNNSFSFSTPVNKFVVAEGITANDGFVIDSFPFNTMRLLYSSVANRVNMALNSGGLINYDNPLGVLNKNFLFDMLATGTNASLSVNNSLIATQSSASFTYGGVSLGQPGGLTVLQYDGYISEVVIYNADQSTNKTGISDNINDFYSIY
jgi:hypothetical protein